MKIRGKTIRFCGKEKKIQNAKEQELIQDIKNLESDQTLSNLVAPIEDNGITRNLQYQIRIRLNPVLSGSMKEKDQLNISVHLRTKTF